MFDAEYFNKHVLDQINELGSSACSLEVHLHSGVSFRVRQLGTVCSGYVLLEIYPQEGVTEESKAARRKPGGTEEIFFDRVAVAYNSISHIFLTVKEPLKKERFGFSVLGRSG
jgi:hypothetical protein